MNTIESPSTALASKAAAYDDAKFLALQTIKSIRVGTVSEGQAMDALATCRNELDNTTADIREYLRGLEFDASHVRESFEYRMTESAGVSAHLAVDELSHVIARSY